MRAPRVPAALALGWERERERWGRGRERWRERERERWKKMHYATVTLSTAPLRFLPRCSGVMETCADPLIHQMLWARSTQSRFSTSLEIYASPLKCTWSCLFQCWLLLALQSKITDKKCTCCFSLLCRIHGRLILKATTLKPGKKYDK